ncbi:MAG: alpha/beta hydrolase family protein [Prolixibacteraceae bacterium]|jgi:S-formylglutathione hydrolase FrmB|nr:alpha/beta hydrolase family protein [Prolixibacteraceae bacterium]MDD4755444.1 alpha/beta hydrolase family protein [Prolixibacteraceae bacterium]NLO03222.1 esterase family protein [Bacteroidales bacterium]
MYKVFFLLIAMTWGNLVPAQKGKVLESLVFNSSKLDYPVEYSIYLPPDYETSQRSYPVLYLLHGYGDDETGWIQFGEADIIADLGIAEGEFPPCIIVMPDGKVTWYINSYDGQDPWEDMFIEEFIPYIEKKYRIRPKKEFRAVGGLSMGGNGSLLLSMRHPDMFSSCVAMSAGIFTDEEILTKDIYERYFNNIYGPGPVKGQVSDYWKSYSVLHLIENTDPDKLRSVRYYIDCGDDDFLYKGNSTLHIKMRDLGITHEYRIRNGGHSWGYWRTSLFDGLKFISEKFHR